MKLLDDVGAHARGVIASSAANFLQLGFGIVTGVVLARSLSPGPRGELAAVMLWSGLGVTVADGGLAHAIGYFSGCFPSSRRQLWRIAFWIGALGGLLIAGLIWTLMPSRVVADRAALAIGLAAVPIAVVATHQSYLALGAGDLTTFNSIRILASVLYSAGVLMVASSGFGSSRAFLWMYFAGQVASLGFGAARLSSRLPAIDGAHRLQVAEVTRYGLKVWTSSMFAQFSLRVDQMALSLIGRASELGLYVIGYTAASIALPLYNAFGAQVLAASADAPHGDSSPDRRALAIAHLRMSALAAAAVSVLTAALMPFVIPIVFGADYGSAVWPAALLCGAVGFSGLNLVFGSAQRVLGRPGAPAFAEGAAGVTGLSAIPILYFQFGLPGVALGSLAAMAAGSVTHLVLFQRVALERRVPVSV